MTDTGDLFDFTGATASDVAAYPNYPGSRGPDTSDAAAADLAPRLGRLQGLVLGAIVGAGERGLTADECCDVLALDRFTVQPRTSELRRLLKIRDSGQRRQNATGKKAIVWTDATLPEAEAPARAA